MNRRSAIAMAAGVVAALLAGVAAVSLGLSSPDTAQAGSGRTEPIVRTVRDTVTVHERAEADGSGTVRVIAAAPQPASPAGTSDDDAHEEHDDGYEDDERYEDEGRGSEDHEEHEDEEEDD
ncbi:MAG TPA: hypothetical protein VF029_04780 [Actinomycetota bacterium]